MRTAPLSEMNRILVYQMSRIVMMSRFSMMMGTINQQQVIANSNSVKRNHSPRTTIILTQLLITHHPHYQILKCKTGLLTFMIQGKPIITFHSGNGQETR
jgi:hypothetical protein